MRHTFNDLPTTPPADDLDRLLAPIRALDPEAHEDTRDPDLLQNELLLAWYPDGSPTWWPLNRDQNGGNWTLTERRRVLAKRLRENLSADISALTRSKSGVRQLLDTLRRIAYEARSQDRATLSS